MFFFQPLLTAQPTDVIQLSDGEEDVKPPKLVRQQPTQAGPSAKKGTDTNGNLAIPNLNLADEDKPSTIMGNMDQEVRDLLNGPAKRLRADTVGQLTTKATNKSKQTEFAAKVMGLTLPDTTHLNRGWLEHPVVKLARDEVNMRFADMPQGQESEKRMGIPLPTVISKSITPTAADTLQGTDMHRLPHSMRTELPQGAKIESLENKSKLPKQVEEEASGILWGMVRTNWQINQIFLNIDLTLSSMYITYTTREDAIDLSSSG